MKIAFKSNFSLNYLINYYINYIAFKSNFQFAAHQKMIKKQFSGAKVHFL